jgi:transposase
MPSSSVVHTPDRTLCDLPTACTAPVYRNRYQQTKARIGKQRGAKVAQIDLARRLSEAIWHMLTRGETFAPKGATDPLAA